MAALDNWDSVCRLCSEQKNEMLPIFGNEGMQRKVAQKLRACLPVLVYKTDPLPKQICQFCAARLDDVYEFREYCLNVYKDMNVKLLTCRDIESVRIFLDAMKNSPDPCQVQLCKENSRALPPLVPLPISLPFDDSVAPLNQLSQDHSRNICIETLPELPCEVEIKEMNVNPMLNVEAAVYERPDTKCTMLEMFHTDTRAMTNMVPMFDAREEAAIMKVEFQVKREEKRTSILEQVLTGNLTMNNRPVPPLKAKLTSQWWCTPCNNYYKTKNSLLRHMRHCPRIYTCRKCSLSFRSVKALAKHEGSNHLKIDLTCIENLKDCDQCDRQFVSWEMLKLHRLSHRLVELANKEINTWCSSCNRSFFTVEAYQNHNQLHQIKDNNSVLPQKSFSADVAFPASNVERPREIKRVEQFYENVKSLACPTCGKVCTQQSALSNHMRTHEPKRHKCEICGRSFGLFIRLAAHRMSEHNKQPAMSPVMSAVEQEEALNAEREAREAREARNRSIKNRAYPEVMEKSLRNNVADDEFAAKFNYNELKNVARCGICQQWFSDHTTMLTHLQTHSDSLACKNFTCCVCKKSFKEQWQLFRHKVCHTKRMNNTSLYTCTSCNKSFMDKVAYKAHQKTHTVDKTYHCAKCNKIFFKEVTLIAHQCTNRAQIEKKIAESPLLRPLSHNNSKKYKCSKCDASFSSSQSRNAHMRMHADFLHNNMAQKRDIKIEAGDETMPKLSPETSLEYNAFPIEPKIEINEQSIPPPLKRTLIKTNGGYRCGVCQSPFVSRDLAVAHLRSAHPVMPYQCPYCKKRFTTQYTFTHHIKTEHPNESEK